MSSGLTYTPADTTGHLASPRSGTQIRVSDGEAASTSNAADYPVAAGCKFCGAWIRLDHLMQMDWRHVPAGAGAAPAPAAGEGS